MARYIDAKAMEKCVKQTFSENPFLMGVLLRWIRKHPTADVAEVVHGRWINWGKSGTPTYENYGTCSVCHEDAEICTAHRNYCPNCGAKMDGGNETC